MAQHMTSGKPVSFGLVTGGKTGYSRLLKWHMLIMCATSSATVASWEVALWLHQVLTVRRTYTLEQYIRMNQNSEKIQEKQEDLSKTFSLQKFYTCTNPWKADKVNHRTLQMDKSSRTEWLITSGVDASAVCLSLHQHSEPQGYLTSFN